MTNATMSSSDLACKKATRKYPGGRTGTAAGYDAHLKAGEKSCPLCAQARREQNQKYRDSMSEERRSGYLKKSRAASARWRESNPEKAKAASRKQIDKRQKFIREFKESSPCMDCGVKYPFYIMEFDHVRGDKVSKISSWGVNNGMQRLFDEIAKCDLVCSNCHMKRTYERMGSERAYARPRTLRNREVIRSSKDFPCADCGERYEPYLMEFDHVRGEKKFNIGALGATSKTDELIEEIAKCDVVCGNCHSARTYRRLTA